MLFIYLLFIYPFTYLFFCIFTAVCLNFVQLIDNMYFTVPW